MPGGEFAKLQLARLSHACKPAAAAQEDRLRWEQLGRPSIAANFLSPTMYGSLPKALSMEERVSISRNTPMSASLRAVQSQTPVRAGQIPLPWTDLAPDYLPEGAIMRRAPASPVGRPVSSPQARIIASKAH